MAEELLPDLLVCPFESIRLTKSKTDFIFLLWSNSQYARRQLMTPHRMTDIKNEGDI